LPGCRGRRALFRRSFHAWTVQTPLSGRKIARFAGADREGVSPVQSYIFVSRFGSTSQPAIVDAINILHIRSFPFAIVLRSILPAPPSRSAAGAPHDKRKEFTIPWTGGNPKMGRGRTMNQESSKSVDGGLSGVPDGARLH
jgi:hypothetical protein